LGLRRLLGQFEVAPGETREIPTEFAAGHYYVGYPPVIVAEGTADGPQTLDIAWDGKEWQRKDKNVRYPGPCLIRAENAADQPATVYYIRRKQYPWTSAAEITSLQNFRDLFSSELISADETFSIRNLFIVFTDIKGSTALYERWATRTPIIWSKNISAFDGRRAQAQRRGRQDHWRRSDGDLHGLFRRDVCALGDAGGL
jgi:hypothetical protein